MDDCGADGQNKIQPVPPFPEEFSPVWEVSREPHDDLDVECNGDGELSAVKKVSMYLSWVNCTSGLYCERGESQDNPKPLRHLVVVFEFIPSGSNQTAVDNTEILVMFSINVDDQAGK